MCVHACTCSVIFSFILRLYAVGGRDGSSCLRSVECFDPHTNRSERRDLISGTLISVSSCCQDGSFCVTGTANPRPHLNSAFHTLISYFLGFFLLPCFPQSWRRCKSLHRLICNLKCAGGIAALQWQKGAAASGWLPGTGFFTPSAGTTPRPRLSHPG